MSKFIYGIDFGTTNSAVAILEIDTNKLVKLFTIPSLLFFPEATNPNEPTEPTVGNDAIEMYVQNRMRGRFMKSIKKVLPNKSFIDTRIGKKMYRAEDLVALILIHLKSLADDFTGQNITQAVIGRPVVFDENPEKDEIAQQRLSKAVEIAGFTEYYFQLEPIGAAFTYERLIDKKETVLVADFGGGTSDFSIMKLRPEAIDMADRQNDMIAQGGIYIGGDNFDSDIMWHKGTPHFGRGVKEEFTKGKPIDLPISYFLNICSWDKMNFLDSLRMRLSIEKSYINSGKDFRVKNLQILIEKNLGYVLFKHIEKVKIDLTKNEETLFDFQENDINIIEPVNLQEFSEFIIDKNLTKIEDYLGLFLEENNIDSDKIDVVFMTGGTSMVKPLKNIFEKRFGAHKIKSGDNFNSVAIGLAYSFKVLQNQCLKSN
jgi:hypothetical chaperone protein